MTPRRIVEMALEKGIDIIGICDHNSAENVTAVIKAAQTEKLKVLPGIEVTSKEEVHILALFGDKKDSFRMQKLIYENLNGENNEEVFGPQVVVNENEEVLRFNKKLLIGATNLSVKKIVDSIHLFNGIAIAAHIDRESFSIIGQLGFIPADLELDGLELSPHISCEKAKEQFRGYNDFPFIHSSDAHFIDDVGCVTTSLLLNKPTFEDIQTAFKEKDRKKIIC